MSPALIPKIATSSNMNINGGSYDRIKFTFTDTGTVSYKATVDGSSWQDITSGSEAIFETAGSTVAWSAVGKSGATITNIALDLGIGTPQYLDSANTPLQNLGRFEIAKFVADDGTYSKPSYLAIGIGTTAIDKTKTVLHNEVKRVALTATNTGTSSIDFSSTIVMTTSISAHEVGYFNASTTGIMYYAKQLGTTVSLQNSRQYVVKQSLKLTDMSEGNNLLTHAGMSMPEQFLRGGTVVRPTATAWGTGTAAISVDDTTLQGQTVINNIPSVGRTGALITLNNILAAGEATTADISKCAIFSGSTTTKTMLMESKFSTIDKNILFQIGNIDSLEYL